jgi:signal peptidase II
MKSNFWDYAYLMIIAALVLCLDQGSKLFVRSTIQPGDIWMPVVTLSPYVNFIHSANTGMALGILQNYNGLFIALSEIACIAIVLLYPSLSRRWDGLLLGLGLGFILGGAAGNLIDRIFLGYVTDIFLVNLFPVFNLADLSIFLGAVLIIISQFRAGPQRKDFSQSV